jgi:hypothetical protein
VFQEFAKRAGYLFIALVVCVPAVFSTAPVGAVPIARGLPTLATVLDETSPQKLGPISILEWVAKNDSSDKPPHLITLSPFGLVDPDGFWAVAGGGNVSTH